MSIRVTEKRRVNYFGAATVGAMAGYSAKWLIPVQAWEKDDRYMSSFSKINRNASSQKSKALSEMAKVKSNQVALDVLAMSKAKNVFAQVRGMKNLDAKAEIMDVISQLNTVSRGVREEGLKSLKLITKSIRPGGTFAFIGALVAFSYAFGKNVFYSNSKID
jgi:hypothetical protein